MTKQEENWELMTTLQIPWYHANQIEDQVDRDFLLNKAKEVKEYMTEQQKAYEEQQGGGSSIITPQDELGGLV
jgi:hypothetical protein